MEAEELDEEDVREVRGFVVTTRLVVVVGRGVVAVVVMVFLLLVVLIMVAVVVSVIIVDLVVMLDVVVVAGVLMSASRPLCGMSFSCDGCCCCCCCCCCCGSGCCWHLSNPAFVVFGVPRKAFASNVFILEDATLTRLRPSMLVTTTMTLARVGFFLQ